MCLTCWCWMLWFAYFGLLRFDCGYVFVAILGNSVASILLSLLCVLFVVCLWIFSGLVLLVLLFAFILTLCVLFIICVFNFIGWLSIVCFELVLWIGSLCWLCIGLFVLASFVCLLFSYFDWLCFVTLFCWVLIMR